MTPPPNMPPVRPARYHSIAWPLILILVGVAFLFRNFVPSIPIWQLFASYWPVLLIALGLIRAAEVLWAFHTTGDAHRYRGLSGGGVIWLVLLCLVIAAVSRHGGPRFTHFGAGGLDLFGEQFDYPVSLSQGAGPAKRLVLENLRGNVTVSGGDSPDVHIEGHRSIKAYNQAAADDANRRSELRLVVEGDQLILRSSEPAIRIGHRVSNQMDFGPPRFGPRGMDMEASMDIDITVPRQLSVDAHGRSGDLTVNTIAGDVNVSAQRGEVRLTGIGGTAHIELVRGSLVRAADVKGDVDLEGRGSDVQLENIAGQVTINGSFSGTLEFRNLAKALHFESERTDLKIAQVPGNITMDLGNFRATDLVGPVHFVTRSRDIHIDGFTESLELEVEHGDIQLKPGKAPVPKIDVHARSGDIHLDLPPNASFNLKGNSLQGEVRNDYGEGVEVLGEGRSATLRSVNPSGPTVTIATDRGTVSVGKT